MHCLHPGSEQKSNSDWFVAQDKLKYLIEHTSRDVNIRIPRYLGLHTTTDPAGQAVMNQLSDMTQSIENWKPRFILTMGAQRNILLGPDGTFFLPIEKSDFCYLRCESNIPVPITKWRQIASLDETLDSNY